MRQALMVAYYVPPLGGGGTQRLVKFVRYLPAFGWRPHVLTIANRDYLVHDSSLVHQFPAEASVTGTRAFLPAQYFRKITQYRPDKQQRATSEADLVTRCKQLFYTCAFIPDEYIGWYPFAVRRGVQEIRKHKPDLIFSTSPPNTCHVIARTLARRTGLPWVADLRDLWNMYPDSYNPFHWRWRQHLDEFLERRVLQDAQQVIVVSSGMRSYLLTKLPRAVSSKIHLITNGFDPEDFEGAQPKYEDKRLTIVHAGTLFPWRPLRPFLIALAELLRKHPQWREQVRLRLLGIVPPSDRSAIEQTGLSGLVEIFEYRPYAETLAHLRSSTIQLLLVGEIPHASAMIPGKLFDYMGSGRPILAIGPEGSARQLVREEKLGLDFRPEETDKIIAALEKWFVQSRNGSVPVESGDWSRFHRRELTRQLAQVFNRAIQSEGVK